MEDQWYLQVDGGEVEGPVAAPLLKQWADMGKVKPNSKVRRGVSGAWVLASRVKGLFASADGPSDLEPPGVPPAEPSFVAVEWPTASLSAPSRAQLVACPDCGKQISRRALTCPHCGLALPRAAPRDKHRALRSVARLLKILAQLAAIGSVVGLIITVAGEHASAQSVIPLVAFLVLGPLALWASGALILLLLDIEQNTRPPSPGDKD